MPQPLESPINHLAAVDGAVADGSLKNMSSGSAEVQIPFGRFVTIGTTPDQVKLPTDSPEALASLGVAVRMQDDVADAANLLQYEIGRNVSILDFGVVYMQVEDAVVAGGDVFARFAAGGGGSDLGRPRSDVDTASAVAIPGATFLDSGSADDLVRVRVRIQ